MARSSQRFDATAIVAVVLVGLTPLVLDPWGLQQRAPAASLIILLLAPVGLGTACGRGYIITSPSLWWLGGLIGVFGIATMFGRAPLHSLLGSPARLLGLLGWASFGLCFMLGLQVSGNGRRWVERALIIGSIPVAVLAIAERGDSLFAFGSGDDLVRSQSTLRNPVFLGAYLALAVPVAFERLLDATAGRWWRAIGGVAMAGGLVALLATQSRGPWLGGFIALTTVGLYSARRRTRWTRLIVAGGLMAVVAVVMASPLRDRAMSIGNTTSGSNAIRLELWSKGISLIGKHPLIGVGPDATAMAFPEVIDDRFERIVTRRFEPDRVHNTELDIAIWGGLPALIAFAGVVVVIARSAWRRRRDIPIGLAAACLGYLVQLQVGFPLADLDAIVWLLAGLLMADTGRRHEVPELASQSARTGLVLVGVAGAFLQGRMVAADHLLGRAVAAEGRGDIVRAGSFYRRATEQANERAHTWQAYTRFALRAAAAGDNRWLDDADRAAARALELTPGEPTYLLDAVEVHIERHAPTAVDEALRVVAHDGSSAPGWFVAGRAELAGGDVIKAAEAWERSATLAPWATGPRLNLAALAVDRGDRTAALRWYREVLILEPDEPTAAGFIAKEP